MLIAEVVGEDHVSNKRLAILAHCRFDYTMDFHLAYAAGWDEVLRADPVLAVAAVSNM